MYVKRLRVAGFKSFADATVDLSPNINAFVGPNGSGKSNLITAIALLLRLDKISSAERESLIHQVGNTPSSRGLIEVTLDNTSRCFGSRSDDVVLARQISQKTDMFTIDDKRVDRSNLAKLLDVAGFAHYNPYFVLHQGQVQKFSLCSDADRLKALKDLSGMHATNEIMHKVKIPMETAREKLDSTSERLAYIQSQRTELEQELRKMSQIEELEEQKIALEYYIAERELRHLVDKDQALLADISRARASVQDVVPKISDIRKRLSPLEAELDELDREKLECESLEDTLRSTVELQLRNEQQASNKFESLKNEIEGLKKELEEARSQKKRLEQEIATTEKAHEEAEQDKNLSVQKHGKLFEELAVLLKEQQDFTARTARLESFRSVEERNHWIENEIKLIRSQMSSKEMSIHELQQSLDRLLSKDNGFAAQGDALAKHRDTMKSKLQEMEMSRIDLQGQSTSLRSQVELLKKKHLHSHQQYIRYNEQCEYAYRRLSSNPLIGPSAIGHKELMDVLSSNPHLNDGIYGALTEFFTFDEELSTAIDAVVGSRLCAVVVLTKHIATNLIKVLQQQGAKGEFKFLPIDVVQAVVQSRNKAKAPANENFIELRKLVKPTRKDDDIATVLDYIFGNVALVKDTSVAKELCQAQYDCVTVEGDQYFRNGLIKGGYRGQSTRALYMDWAQLREKCIEASSDLSEVANHLDQNTKTFQKILEDTQAVCLRVDTEHKAVEKIESEMRNLKLQRNENQSAKKMFQEQLDQYKLDMRLLENSLDNYRKELSNEGGALSSPEYRAKVDNIKDLEKRTFAAFELRQSCEAKENALHNLLCLNLRPALEELKNGTLLHTIEAKVKELKVERSSAKNEQLLAKQTTEDLEQVHGKLENLLQFRDARRTRLQEESSKLNELEELLQAKTQALEALLLRREHVSRKIKQIKIPAKPLISDADELQGLSLTEQGRKLRDIKKKLEQLGPVNRLAKSNVKSHREALKKFNKEYERLVKDHAEVQDAWTTYESLKEENFHRVLCQVRTNFKNIFSTLVPGGKGVLVPRTKQPASTPESGSESQSGSLSVATDSSLQSSAWSGLSLRVSFTGSEFDDVSSLSGGQKSLCSLAFIFALQQCNPTPCLILDEVDAALDTNFRSAGMYSVESRINDCLRHLEILVYTIMKWMSREEQSSSDWRVRQVICTTFRQEFVEKADKFFGIRFGANKVSKVEEISKEGALKFIQETV